MKWLAENYMIVVFLLTTILAVIKAILLMMGKKKAAEALDKVKDMLHQTFGNVEKLKIKWKESGAEEKYGHIGTIFTAINKGEKVDKVLKVAYEEWLKEQETKEISG